MSDETSKAAEGADEGSSGEAAGGEGADLKRKFAEALARKQGGGGAAAPGAATQSKGVGPSTGGKVQRQFRRKAGG